MSANAMWTSEEDKILIDFVRNHEALYYVNSKDYRKTQLKRSLWNNIGTTLEKSGSDCYKRWAYVRDYYIRRRGKTGIGSSGEAAKKRSALLSFLESVPSPQRHIITNIVEGELYKCETEITEDTRSVIENPITEIEDTTEDMTRITCIEDNGKGSNNKRNDNKNEVIRDKKMKKITHSEEELQLMKQISQGNSILAQNELDETDLFFSSIAKIVKKLPRYEQIQLRMQISSLVGNAELKCISNESS